MILMASRPLSVQITALLAALFFGSICSAQNDEFQEAQKLFRGGQHAQALERVDVLLKSSPKDARSRFLKGSILTAQNKTAEAIQIFSALTEDYPELPEPYNNLAVLYAQQGQYDKARSALELSIRTHPSYATAHENLGDIYAKMASQAYDKALKLDSTNTTAQTKLALVRDLVPNSSKPAKPGVQIARAAEPAKQVPMVIAQATPPATSPGTKPAATEAKPTPAKPTPTGDSQAKDGSDEVLKMLGNWAKAWSSKDVSAYLGHYAPDFKTLNGEPRAVWESERRRRINAAKNIEVALESPTVKINGNSATVAFRQNYRSDAVKLNSAKTLSLTRSNGKWLIQQERSGN